MGNSGGKAFGKEAGSVLDQKVTSQESMPEPMREEGKQVAIFAAGCFWSVELSFQRVPGVLQTEVGYTDGHASNPSYEAVCAGNTGHTEAVRLEYDSSQVSYADLLTVLWDRMDPTTLNRQGNDAGTQYRSGIYYTSEAQKAIALESKAKEQKKYSQPIVTEIKAFTKWFKAEDYHQHYLEKGGQCSRKGNKGAIRCYG